MVGKPFTLKIFVPAGDPEGLRIIERSNWPGKALVFPRALYMEVKGRQELDQTGVYVLTGSDESGTGEVVYIGEGDPVRFRLDSHYAKKDFWTRAVVFVAPQSTLNKAHVQYLEARLVDMALATKRATLDNGNKPAEPSLSESDRADMDVFLENMLSTLPILAVYAFERPAAVRMERRGEPLFCSGKGKKAEGYESSQGFIVRAGSQASREEAPSIHQFLRDQRAELLRRGVMEVAGDHYRFSQDYTFSSPSSAAAVVLGRNANGRTEWRTAAGTTLKSLQELEAAAGE